MRIALISDIHGMYVALEAVLADIQHQHVDQIICLGDVATLGPQPYEVVARLKALACPCIMGNHDVFLLDAELIHTYTSVPMVLEPVDWCVRQLTTTDVEYVRSFQPVITADLE